MANEKITIASQRNMNDVATELTIAYMEKYALSKEEIAEAYKLFFRTAVDAFNEEY